MQAQPGSQSNRVSATTGLSVPRICVCYAPESDSRMAANLSTDLRTAGVHVQDDIGLSEWALLLQTPKALHSPVVAADMSKALALSQQRKIKGLFRFVIKPSPPGSLSSEWSRLRAFDATQDYCAALEELLDVLKYPDLSHASDEVLSASSPPSLGASSSAAALSVRKVPSSQELYKAYSPLPASRVVVSPPAADARVMSISDLRARPWFITTVLTLSLLIIICLGLVSLRLSTPSPAAHVISKKGGGNAYFLSSGMLDASNTQGLNDGIELDVSDIIGPAQGKRDYVWLLPDLNQTEGTSILMGTLTVNQGRARLQYWDPSHADLLGRVSRLLITEQDSDTPPDTPSPDRSTWRYYAEIPQQPNAKDMMHLSLLDHLRHLLVSEPHLEQMGLHGGLATWFLQDTRKSLEWANAARGTGQPQNPDLMHRHFARILGYLDGIEFARAHDVPPGTPILVDPMAGQIGLLDHDLQAMPPGYTRHISMHLDGLIESPGVPPSQRTLAGRLNEAMTVVKGELDQARKDAIQLVRTPEDRLGDAQSLQALNDLVEQLNDAYVGKVDPQTGTRQGGAIWIADQLRHLAAFQISHV